MGLVVVVDELEEFEELFVLLDAEEFEELFVLLDGVELSEVVSAGFSSGSEFVELFEDSEFEELLDTGGVVVSMGFEVS